MRLGWLLTGMMALVPASASAEVERCRIGSSTSDEISRLLDERGYDFEGYERLCTFLKARGLKIEISGDSGVLGGRAYGWAMVRFEDRATGVRSDRHYSSTTLNMNADTPTARLSLWRSLNGTLSDIAARTDSMIEMAQDVATQKARLRERLAAATAGGGASRP